MSITGIFNPVAGRLSVVGDAADNDVTVSRDVAGAIRVNGGAVDVDHGDDVTDFAPRPVPFF